MSRDRLIVTILGSGTSTGVPVIGCSCRVCSSADERDRRTRCSALLSWGGRNVLIDTSTDLRQQALREELTRIDAVLYTHTHADHLHGIDDLRPFNFASGEPIPIFGSAETVTLIRRNFGYIFSEETDPGYRPRLQTHQVDGPFELFGRAVTPLLLHHGEGRSLGFRVGPLAYLTDCSAVPEASFDRLAGVELLIVDGLRYRPHATHFNIAEAVAFAARVGAGRTLLTHLSHEVEHAACDRALPPGVELAYDGQRVALGTDDST